MQQPSQTITNATTITLVVLGQKQYLDENNIWMIKGLELKTILNLGLKEVKLSLKEVKLIIDSLPKYISQTSLKPHKVYFTNITQTTN